MTSPSVLTKTPKSETEGALARQVTDFIELAKRGIIARSQGRVQSLDEVIAELDIR
jgi:hypothetical protein